MALGGKRLPDWLTFIIHNTKSSFSTIKKIKLGYGLDKKAEYVVAFTNVHQIHQIGNTIIIIIIEIVHKVHTKKVKKNMKTNVISMICLHTDRESKQAHQVKSTLDIHVQ